MKEVFCGWLGEESGAAVVGWWQEEEDSSIHQLAELRRPHLRLGLEC